MPCSVSRPSPRLGRGALLLLLAATGSVLSAGRAGSQPRGGEGYLFRPPSAALTLRMGVAHPAAGGGLFTFVRDQLTLGSGAFTGINAGADFGVMLSPRLAVQVGAAVQYRTTPSEYRDFVGTDDLPIGQETTFQRAPLWAGLQWHLVPIGERVGRLAWVPNRLVPYVAAGGGLMHYRFRQDGEFVDAESLDIFRSTMSSGGWAPMGFAAAGATVSLTPRVALSMELRREQARGTTAGSFRDFRTIDLSGTSATVGLTFRY